MDEYARAVMDGRRPIERGFRYTPVDLRLTTLFQMLQAMKVDIVTYQTIFGTDPVEEFAPIWQALEDGYIRLKEDGIFYTPLVQNLLAEARLEEMGVRGAAMPETVA